MHAQIKQEGTYTPDALLAGSADDCLVTRVVIAAGQVQPCGALLGKVTASKKHVLSLAAADDGSQTPDVVLAEDVDATAGDTEAMAYFTGPINAHALTLGAGHSVDSVFAALRANGIYLVK
ncbi:head decoration protein [Laribacter hongkongensis]|uniref:head decoration protein n=1 Tax=Laribacter hongkongensis TaxID=168471 RepID=UPI000415EE31|nr:head decoration protein [Laribacter hongkongensis]